MGYATSPFDLIPDPIPALGYLDDLLLLLLGILAVRALIPDEVFSKCRERTAAKGPREMPGGRVIAVLVILVWIVLLRLATWNAVRWLGEDPAAAALGSYLYIRAAS